MLCWINLMRKYIVLYIDFSVWIVLFRKWDTPCLLDLASSVCCHCVVVMFSSAAQSCIPKLHRALFSLHHYISLPHTHTTHILYSHSVFMWSSSSDCCSFGDPLAFIFFVITISKMNMQGTADQTKSNYAFC